MTEKTFERAQEIKKELKQVEEFLKDYNESVDSEEDYSYVSVEDYIDIKGQLRSDIMAVIKKHKRRLEKEFKEL